MPNDILRITYGGTDVAFDLLGPVPATLKPKTGELRRQTGSLLRSDILDAPWSITHWLGLGVARATQFDQDPENRLFGAENVITHIPGLACLTAQKQSSSLPAEVTAVEFHGFRSIIGETFMFGQTQSTAEDVQEAILYLDASADHVDSTSRNDIADGTQTNATYIITSMVGHAGRAYAAQAGTQQGTSGGPSIRVIRSDVGTPTAWNVISTGTSTNPMTAAPYGIESDGNLMYVAAYASNVITINESPTGSNGAAWNGFTSNPTIHTSRAPVLGNAAVMFPDGSAPGVVDYWLGTAEKLWQLDISAEVAIPRVTFQHPQSAYTGQIITAGASLVYTDGPDLHVGRWTSKGWFDQVVFSTDKFPALKRGDITAIAFIPGLNLIAFAVGGGPSLNAGVYLQEIAPDGSPVGYPHNLYYNTTASRPIFALGFTTETEGTPKMLMAEDNATADDSDAFHFDNITRDPRTVSGYLHETTLAANLILPKNDRYLQELNGVWYQVEGLGTNFSTARYITAYKSADAAPTDSDGSWTQLQDNAGAGDVIDGTTTVNYFPATPNATGESANTMQIRLGFTGASNASPYLETLNVHVRKDVVDKRIWSFHISLAGRGSVNPSAQVLQDMIDVAGATTLLQCEWGGHATGILEPWKGDEAGPIQYSEDGEHWGTINSLANPTTALLRLVER